MSVSFVLVGSQIKRFKHVVKSLAAIGSELLVEALPEKLILRAINSAHSAFLAVSLSSHFFESYNVFSQAGVVQAGILIKHMLATFRSTRVSSMSCELNEQSASLKVTLRCDNGLLKRYGLDINSTDILQANLDGSGLPVSVVAEASELNKLLNTFQSTLDEVSIIALPAQQATAATGGGQAAAAQRCVKLQSFYDPAKAAGSKALHTSMSLDTSSVFKSYSNSASCPSDVTVNLKDLKALVGLCCELGADVVLKFDEAGVPLLAVPHAPGVQAMDYSAELILSTLQESVHRAGDDDATEGQQQAGPTTAAAAAAAGNGAAPAAPAAAAAAAAAAEQAETIAPASTFKGAAAAGGGGGGAETPQGGTAPRGAGSGSVLRFRPTAAAAAAGSGGGGVSGGGGISGGGRSGGRARSGGSRWEQMQAALAEQEEQQQQEQQYRQQQQYSNGMMPPGPAGAEVGGQMPGKRVQQEQPAQPQYQQQYQQQPQQYQQQPQQQQQQPQQQQWNQGGCVSQEAGQAHFESSLDDVEMLPRQRVRTPPPPAAPAGTGHDQQQQQQQQQAWGQFHHQEQQPQQQQEMGGGGVAAAAGVPGDGNVAGMDFDDEEELCESQPDGDDGDHAL